MKLSKWERFVLQDKLIKAVESGQKEEILKLTNEGAVINEAYKLHNPMLKASFKENIEMMQFLLDAGADINLILSNDAGLLHEAIERKKGKSIEFFLQNGADINLATQINRITPLHRASKFNETEHHELIKYLLQKGANVNAKTSLGTTPLHYLCGRFLNRKINNQILLIDHGADINAKDEFGVTPLHLAVLNNHEPIVDLLLNHRCDVNSEDIYGETPLSIAKSEQLNIIVDKLLQAGAKESNNPKEPIVNIDQYKNNLWLPHTLHSYRERLLETVQPFIRINATEDSSLSLWQSKFGGYPYLPKDEKYPHSSDGKALFFLAQINFEETPNIPPFPQRGILLFFIPSNYIEGRPSKEDKTKQDFFRLIYFQDVCTDITKLTTEFTFLSDHDEDFVPVEKPCSLNFELDYAPLSPDDFHFEKKFEGLKTYESLNNSFREENRIFKFRGHKIGGYPGFVQADPRYNPVDEKDEQNKNVLLFQMDTDRNVCWGDGGNANFFINEKDLINLNFSNVFYSWSGG